MRRSSTKARVLTEPVTLEALALNSVSGTLSDIWHTLVAPETALELDESVYDAGRLGSKRGLGEMQYFLHRLDDGRTFASVLEVIAYDHQRRAQTNLISDLGFDSRSEVIVDSLETGRFRETYRFSRTVPPGTPAQLVSEHERAVKEYAKGVERGITRVFGTSPPSLEME